MGAQLSLFGEITSTPQGTAAAVRESAAQIAAMTRREDAETSKLAAEHMVVTGKLRENQAKVLAALVREPGSTYAELARIAGLPEPEPARRLPELVRLGLALSPVIDGKRLSRPCTVRGTECSQWWPTAAGYELVESNP